MQNDIMSPADGTVLDVCVSEGDNVKTGEEMVILA
jgi:biotin carboxyl carrier protein